MNLIERVSNITEPYENREHFDASGERLYYIKDFRAQDYAKIGRIVNDIYSNINRLSQVHYEMPFEHSISLTNTTKHKHIGFAASHFKELKIDQSFNDISTTIKAVIPRLMYNNFFVLNGNNYVPLLFLEKAPIDRIFREKENKIFINLNAISQTISFDFRRDQAVFKKRPIPLSLFFEVVFERDPEYIEYLRSIELITSKIQYNSDGESIKLSLEKKKKFIKVFLDIHQWEQFIVKDIVISDWIDEFLLLDYYRSTFKSYYNIDNFQDIVKRVVELSMQDEEVNMASLTNRRLVMTEYLIRPLLELYDRLLYSVVDKKNNNALPSINQNSILTTGFNKMLHQGQLYDISNPYALPLINKVSQDIQIIKQGRLPKSWQRNDETGFGVICPITVSPQHMATTLVFTSDAKVNQYGKIQIRRGK